MSEIDLSAIQYVPPSHENTEQPQGEDKDVDKMIQKAKKMKKAMDKENKEVDDKTKQDEAKDKTWLILFLRGFIYAPEFKGKLNQFKKTKFEKMSLQQLQDMKKEFEAIISAEGSVRDMKNSILSTIQMLETVATIFTPIKCKGLYKSIESDEDAIADIKHICLKHMPKSATEPEYRLAKRLIFTLVQLHNENSLGLQPVNDKLLEVNQKYNDL